MSDPNFMVISSSHGNFLIAPGRVEHWKCNAEIGSQVAQELGLDSEIVAPDRLCIHSQSSMWNLEDYHRRYVELFIEKGLA